MTPARQTTGQDRTVPTGDQVAIAFSGGGDSTALLHMWRHRLPRPIVLIVDHALRSGSRGEAETARDFSESLGFETQILTWEHDAVPQTGLQEKARKARYGLLGQACRDAGRRYLLTGHTQDDQAETLLMRQNQSTNWRGAVGMMEMTYAPVWPELAQVTLYRPLLGMSREYLRAYNHKHQLTWTEDPSNENMGFARIRARAHLGQHPSLKRQLLKTSGNLLMDRIAEYERFRKDIKGWRFNWAGNINCGHMPDTELLMMAVRCVGGQARSGVRHKYADLRRKCMAREIDIFTIGGAVIMRGEHDYIICRDPVAVTGRSDGNLPPSAEPKGLTSKVGFWDGRFMVSALSEGYTVMAPAYTNAAQSGELKAQLARLHPLARKTAPIVVYQDQDQAYAASEAREVICKSLVQERLEAMLGLHGIPIA